MLKVNNENTRTMCEICSKLAMKIPERLQWHRVLQLALIRFFKNILLIVFCQLTNNKYRFVRISLITNDHATGSGGLFRQKAYKYHGFYMHGLWYIVICNKFKSVFMHGNILHLTFDFVNKFAEFGNCWQLAFACWTMEL